MPILNNESNNKFLRGETLDDDELNRLLKFYRHMLGQISQLDCPFSFAKREIQSRYSRLESYKRSRKEN